MKNLTINVELTDDVAARWEKYFSIIKWDANFIVESIEQNMIRQVFGRQPYDGINVVDGYIKSNEPVDFDGMLDFNYGEDIKNTDVIDEDDLVSTFTDIIGRKDNQIQNLRNTLSNMISTMEVVLGRIKEL